MKYFITHYTPLVERKESILYQLQEFQITDYEFIETYDKEDLTEENLSKFTEIQKSEISLFLKHIEILKKPELEDEIVIILEDDAFFDYNYTYLLNKYLSNLPEKWDILFPGSCLDLHAKSIIPEKHFYTSNLSRGTCMYILNKGVAKRLYDIFQSQNVIDRPYDWWLDRLNRTHQLIFHWTEPVLVYQGSEIGAFKSELREEVLAAEAAKNATITEEYRE